MACEAAASASNDGTSDSPGGPATEAEERQECTASASTSGVAAKVKASAKAKAASGSSYQAERLAKMLYIGVAYAATIGGVATLTGTPTNLILIENLRKCAIY